MPIEQMQTTGTLRISDEVTYPTHCPSGEKNG